MLGSPIGAEAELGIVVNAFQGRFVAKVVQVVVAVLRLDAPVRGGDGLTGIQDREFLTLRGLAYEFGLFGRKAILDHKLFGGGAHYDQLVTGLPGPGQKPGDAGTLDFDILRKDSTDGNQIPVLSLD